MGNHFNAMREVAKEWARAFGQGFWPGLLASVYLTSFKNGNICPSYATPPITTTHIL